MRWSMNLPSTTVKIEQALILITVSSWRCQMLVTSRMTTPPSSCQTLTSGCASDFTRPRRVTIRSSMASRPMIVGALAKVRVMSSA